MEEKQSMTKQEAIDAMKGGYRVAHRFFSEGEYIILGDKDYFMDEEGYVFLKKDFWECRQGKEWETGWRIEGHDSPKF